MACRCLQLKDGTCALGAAAESLCWTIKRLLQCAHMHEIPEAYQHADIARLTAPHLAGAFNITTAPVHWEVLQKACAVDN